MSSSVPFTRSVNPRILSFGAAVLAVLGSTAAASTPVYYAPPKDTHTEKPKLRATVDQRPERLQNTLDAVFDDKRPSHAANLITNGAVSRVVERLRELQQRGATAGAESKETKGTVPAEPSLNISVYGEYNYITSNDKRQVDTDSITNAGSGGIDLTLGKTLVGLIYYYSHLSGSSDFLGSNSSADSNFISLYAAHPITPWLSLGVTGGYGHTDVDVFLRARDGRRSTSSASDLDSWTASPFLSLSYATGNCYASLTTTYQYLHTDTDDTGKLNVQVVGGYHFADWITGEINGKFSQMLHDTRGGIPEDDNWFGVGAKLKEYITPNFGLYQAYEFNVNDDFEEHMFTGGLTYSF